MPKKDKDGKDKEINNDDISNRTEKQIDILPAHAQEIFKEAHKNALDQYKDPKKRRGGKQESQEEVAHKVAWSAVKRTYKKDGDNWIKK
jgi:cation transport regulator